MQTYLECEFFSETTSDDYDDDMKLTLEDLYMDGKQNKFEKILEIEWRKKEEKYKSLFYFPIFSR